MVSSSIRPSPGRLTPSMRSFSRYEKLLIFFVILTPSVEGYATSCIRARLGTAAHLYEALGVPSLETLNFDARQPHLRDARERLH